MSNHNFSIDPEKARQYIKDNTPERPFGTEYGDYRDVPIQIWNDPDRIVYYRDNYINNPSYRTDRTAQAYQQDLYSRVEKMLAEVPPGGKILDIGCGRGLATLANAIERPDAVVVGSDHNLISGTSPYDPNAGGGYQLVQGNWLELPETFPEEEFDLVFCMCSALLHFKTERQMHQIIDGITHITKLGGILRASGDLFWSSDKDPDKDVVKVLREKYWHVRPVKDPDEIEWYHKMDDCLVAQRSFRIF